MKRGENHMKIHMKKSISLISLLVMVSIFTFPFALADEAVETNVPVTEVTESNIPDIPAGTFSASVMNFTPKQTYPVYSAPDTNCLRGANKRAVVSTNDWIQVFGAEGDWIMVQYDISDQRYRIGYTYKNALDADAVVPELSLTNADAVASYDTVVTDDPLLSGDKLTTIRENQKVTCLGVMGNWSYIEGETEGKRFRGFVPTEALSGVVSSLEEAKFALTGNWSLYAGNALIAESITFNEDGSMLGRNTGTNGYADEWTGRWSLSVYDPARERYWNDPEFELNLFHDGIQQFFGLRICRHLDEYGGYALVLADSESCNGMVLCD